MNAPVDRTADEPALTVAQPAKRWPIGGLVLMALMIVGWGMNWPASKTALNEIEPLLQRTVALLAGGVGLLGLARMFGYSLRVARREIVPLVGVTIFHITIWHVASAYGLSLMQAGRASIIANTIPLWVSLLGIWLLREPVTFMRATGLFLGLAGLALLVVPDLAVLQAAPYGPLFMAGAAFASGTGTVLMKRYQWSTPLTVLTGWSVLIGGIPIYLAAWLFDAGIKGDTVSLPAILGLAYTVLVATIFCHWCWFKIVTLFPAPVAAVAMFGVPMVGVFASAIFLGESVGLLEIGALVLVLAGIACVVYVRRAPVPPEPIRD